jgi:curved DNA-binding protein CbpA
MKRPREGSSGAVPPDGTNSVEARSPIPQGALSQQGTASPASTATHYELLCIPTNATVAQIEKGYRLQALKKHPDRLIPQLVLSESSSSSSVDAEIERIRAEFQSVQKAYEDLKDDRKRAEYDGRLGLNLASRALAAVLGRRAGAQADATNGAVESARSRPSPQPASGVDSESDDDDEEYVPATVRIVRRATPDPPAKVSTSKGRCSFSRSRDSSRVREDGGFEASGADCDPMREDSHPKFWELFLERPDLKSQWGLDVRNDSLIIEGLTGNAKVQLVPLRQAMCESGNQLRYRIISCNGRPVSSVKEFCDATCGTRQLLLGLSRVGPVPPPAPLTAPEEAGRGPLQTHLGTAEGERHEEGKKDAATTDAVLPQSDVSSDSD